MFAQLKNRGASFSRWLSLLLVVFILYGTTVEAAHRHGRILPASVSTAAHVDNHNTQNLGTSKTGCNDCLICQLHQNFTTTLISLRQNDPPVLLRQRIITVAPQELLSAIIRPLSGRAPPQAN
jgi:hypothetical protein